MSIPEIPNDARDNETLSEIRSAIDSLRAVFQVAALSGIILSAAVFLFLYKEVSLIGRQNDELKNYIADYNTNVVGKIEMTRTNLETFARTNPTMVPILRKYFPTNAAATNAPAAKP